MTMLKFGEPNPLGGADLSYAERVEYASVATLKEKLRNVLASKTTAARRSKEVAYHIYDGGKPLTHHQLQEHVRSVLKACLSREANQQNESYSDLRRSGVRRCGALEAARAQHIKDGGQKKGAIYVFSDNWVFHDHEVTGV